MTANDRPTDHLSADPDDLENETPDDAGASTGLDRPVPRVGPVPDPSDPSVRDDDLGLEDRAMG